jgi:CheY-like chemotaxis protein
MNLVTNAFDAMTEGGRLRIATANVYLDDPLNGYEVVPEGEYAILRVGDSGVGIPPSNLDRIFEPFFSSKPMGTHGGSGLGLAVVYGVIKDHKGYIDVRSEPGGGTEFTLYLPIGRNAVPTMMRQIPLPEVDGARILVVDDDLGMRHLLQTVFVEMGCEVTLATNGREAVQAITDEVVRGATRPDAGPFSLVFLDMNLDQDLNGLDTYREIVALAPRQRFVFMSGLGGSPEMEEVARSGLGQILTKPFSLEALTAVVSK